VGNRLRRRVALVLDAAATLHLSQYINLITTAPPLFHSNPAPLNPALHRDTALPYIMKFSYKRPAMLTRNPPPLPPGT
jgi:hypothetical protein